METGKKEDTEVIEDWCYAQSYDNSNKFVEKLREAFSDREIVTILAAIETTCNHCWDNPTRNCQCWNDE